MFQAMNRMAPLVIVVRELASMSDDSAQPVCSAIR